jgi:hypothetical protein
MSQKIIRDPVHDVIAFHLERPIDALLFNLLGACEVQRLRRVHQLGLAVLAYPGADHSRYSHSLGVMETARKMLEQLRVNCPISDQQEALLLAAALLHDIGHGPFSHVFERVSGVDHEEAAGRILNDPQSDVHQILAAHDPQLPGQVAEFLSGRQTPSFLHDILFGPLDADRFDYLLRDNHHTGSRYGNYDLQWLLHALSVDPGSQRLVVVAKGISAVEDYLQARYHMYRNVYFHKVVRSAEGMLLLALQRARRLAVQGRLQWPQAEDPVRKALVGQQLSNDEFVRLDDVSILSCFKLWEGGEDGLLAGLCRGLLFRRLYKTIDLSHVADAGEFDAKAAAARRAITAAGGEADYELFVDQPADSAYTEDDATPGAMGRGILVRDNQEKLTDFADISRLPAALFRQLQFKRIHVAPAFKDVALRAVGM